MERDELIKKIMHTAEYYKDGKLYATGAMTDIGIFIDEYIESKFKNNGGLSGVSGSFQIERRGKKIEIMKNIDWTKQHCGVHQASFKQLAELMPDLECIKDSFPENVNDFTWDVKVHMLMPNQFPCIPNWHFDNVPRLNNKQDFDAVKLDKHMYLWISNAPFTEFRKDGKTWFVEPQTWTKFTQRDEHRGTMSNDFQWRGFIRATHQDILPQNKNGLSPLRRHSQVYLDSGNFSW